MEERSLGRSESLDRLRQVSRWDLAVIGGGATGLGTAVDAAARGYQTVLLEAGDFTRGTSSRSTKLVHGGVRYLAQGQLSLVREALRERGTLLRNAPHLVRACEFVVPAYRLWELPYYGAGLWLYDRLAGRLRLGRCRWMSRSEVERQLPTLRSQGLRGAISYQDGQFDDARLGIALARTLADLGGTALNYMQVVGFHKRAGRIEGVESQDRLSGEHFTIPARGVINATGVDVDALRRMDDPGARDLLVASQGTHLVLDRSFLPRPTAILIPRTRDGRVLFAIPWWNRVLVGTTETRLTNVPGEPRPLAAEVDFLLEHAGDYLAKRPDRGDIKSMFAGLRPLIRPSGADRSTARIAREHAVVVSKSGLVTITGGKWTTYRVMAQEAVDRAARVANLPDRRCTTETLRLHGWSPPVEPSGSSLDVYGADREALLRVIREVEGGDRLLHPALPYLEGEVVWGVRHEAAMTVEDVLARRTRALFLDARASIEVAPRVAALMACELGRDPSWVDHETRRFRDRARSYLEEGP